MSKQDIQVGDYVLEDELGSGGFAKVMRATHIPTGEKVAIKILDKILLKEDPENLKRMQREIAILKLVKHKNIVKLYEVMESPLKIYLVMELCEGGELFDYIVKRHKLDEKQACQFFQEIIDALDYLHSQNIVHRDIKPENMLLDINKKTNRISLKIIDFGISTSYTSSNLLKTPCGTSAYAPPEMHKGEEYYGLLSDVWSAGIVLYAMVYGYLPFCEEDEDVNINNIINGDYDLVDSISRNLQDLIKHCMDIDPLERYDFSQIKRHPWFNLVKPPYLRPGIIVGYNKIPVDKRIIKICEQFGYEPEKINYSVANNKYDRNSAIYNIVLKKLTKDGFESVSDLQSQEFLEFIGNEENLVNYTEKKKHRTHSVEQKSKHIQSNNSFNNNIHNSHNNYNKNQKDNKSKKEETCKNEEDAGKYSNKNTSRNSCKTSNMNSQKKFNKKNEESMNSTINKKKNNANSNYTYSENSSASNNNNKKQKEDKKKDKCDSIKDSKKNSYHNKNSYNYSNSKSNEISKQKDNDIIHSHNSKKKEKKPKNSIENSKKKLIDTSNEKESKSSQKDNSYIQENKSLKVSSKGEEEINDNNNNHNNNINDNNNNDNQKVIIIDSIQPDNELLMETEPNKNIESSNEHSKQKVEENKPKIEPLSNIPEFNKNIPTNNNKTDEEINQTDGKKVQFTIESNKDKDDITSNNKDHQKKDFKINTNNNATSTKKQQNKRGIRDIAISFTNREKERLKINSSSCTSITYNNSQNNDFNKKSTRNKKKKETPKSKEKNKSYNKFPKDDNINSCSNMNNNSSANSNNNVKKILFTKNKKDISQSIEIFKNTIKSPSKENLIPEFPKTQSAKLICYNKDNLQQQNENENNSNILITCSQKSGGYDKQKEIKIKRLIIKSKERPSFSNKSDLYKKLQENDNRNSSKNYNLELSKLSSKDKINIVSFNGNGYRKQKNKLKDTSKEKILQLKNPKISDVLTQEEIKKKLKQINHPQTNYQYHRTNTGEKDKFLLNKDIDNSNNRNNVKKVNIKLNNLNNKIIHDKKGHTIIHNRNASATNPSVEDIKRHQMCNKNKKDISTKISNNNINNISNDKQDNNNNDVKNYNNDDIKNIINPQTLNAIQNILQGKNDKIIIKEFNNLSDKKSKYDKKKKISMNLNNNISSNAKTIESNQLAGINSTNSNKNKKLSLENLNENDLNSSGLKNKFDKKLKNKDYELNKSSSMYNNNNNNINNNTSNKTTNNNVNNNDEVPSTNDRYKNGQYSIRQRLRNIKSKHKYHHMSNRSNFSLTDFNNMKQNCPNYSVDLTGMKMNQPEQSPQNSNYLNYLNTTCPKLNSSGASCNKQIKKKKYLLCSSSKNINTSEITIRRKNENNFNDNINFNDNNKNNKAMIIFQKILDDDGDYNNVILPKFYNGPIDINCIISSNLKELCMNLIKCLDKNKINYSRMSDFKFHCSKKGDIFDIEIFSLTKSDVCENDLYYILFRSRQGDVKKNQSSLLKSLFDKSKIDGNN